MLGGFLPSDAGAPDYWADSFISLISPDEIVNLPPPTACSGTGPGLTSSAYLPRTDVVIGLEGARSGGRGRRSR